MQGAQTTDYKSVRTLLAEQAAKFGDKPYMVSIDQDEKALSYDALYRLGNRMAHFFAERGLKPNDRVLMLSENSVEFVAVFLGVQRCGATIATANVEMNRAHIGEILHAVDPVLVLVQEGLGLEELRAPDMAAAWIMLGDWNEIGGSTGFFDLLSGHPDDDDIAEVCMPEDIAVIFYTSGTEAKPKGVMQAHSAVWPNYDATADCVELDETSRVVDCRSYTWLSSQNMSLGGPLARGATVFMAKKFSRSHYFDWVQKYQATMAVSVPTILNMFLNEPVDIHGDDIPHLRFFMTSSAPMPRPPAPRASPCSCARTTPTPTGSASSQNRHHWFSSQISKHPPARRERSGSRRRRTRPDRCLRVTKELGLSASRRAR